MRGSGDSAAKAWHAEGTVSLQPPVHPRPPQARRCCCIPRRARGGGLWKWGHLVLTQDTWLYTDAPLGSGTALSLSPPPFPHLHNERVGRGWCLRLFLVQRLSLSTGLGSRGALLLCHEAPPCSPCALGARPLPKPPARPVSRGLRSSGGGWLSPPPGAGGQHTRLAWRFSHSGQVHGAAQLARSSTLKE